MRISITGKICFVLLIIFSGALLATTTFQAYRERELLLQLNQMQLEHEIQAYAEGLADLQTQGNPTLETELREVLKTYPQMLSVQVQPAAPLRHLFAPLPTDDPAPDAKMRQALEGHASTQLQQHNGSSRLILYRPLPAPAGSQGKVLGAVKLVYSMDRQLDKMEQHLLTTALLLCAIFGAGVLLAIHILRRQIVAPLIRLNLALERATDLKDLAHRLPVEQDDEIGRLCDSYNQLMMSLQAQEDSRLTHPHPTSNR